MGTRFINTKESAASEDYKKMIMESSAEDIVYTAAVSGVHANFIRASLESVGITEDRWKDTKKIDFGKELNPLKKQRHGKQYGLQDKVLLLIISQVFLKLLKN